MVEYYCSKDGILKRTIVDTSFGHCNFLNREQGCLDCENIRDRNGKQKDN